MQSANGCAQEGAAERKAVSEAVPDSELDAPVRELVRVLNEEFDGVTTIGSCGGHEDGAPGDIHASADEWWVTFELEPADPSAAVAAPSPRAWLDLEFLAYWLGGLSNSREVALVPYAQPPHLNEPGRMLRFEIRGLRTGEGGIEPDDVATSLREGLDELYVRGGESPKR
jgi:hypothetical protein